MSMGWVDALILIVIGVGFYQGFSSGLVRLLVSLGVWLASFVLGMSYAPVAASLLFQGAEPSSGKIFAGFVVIVIVVMLIGFLVSWLLESILKAAQLGVVNRSLGGLFGAAKNALVLMLLVALFMPLLQHVGPVSDSVLIRSAKPHFPGLVDTASTWLGWASQRYAELKA